MGPKKTSSPGAQKEKPGKKPFEDFLGEKNPLKSKGAAQTREIFYSPGGKKPRGVSGGTQPRG